MTRKEHQRQPAAGTPVRGEEQDHLPDRLLDLILKRDDKPRGREGPLQDAPQLLHSCRPCGHSAYDVRPQDLREGAIADLNAKGLRLVVHVQREDERHLHLRQLRRQDEGALEVLRVGHQHDARGLLVLKDAARDPFALAGRQQAVAPRSVDNEPLAAVDLGEPARHLDGRARVVGDGHVATRETAEENGLADVRVPHQDDGAPVLRFRRIVAVTVTMHILACMTRLYRSLHIIMLSTC